MGKLVYKSGDIYIGEVQNGICCGYGEKTFQNGDTYKGDFNADQFHGQGELQLASGEILEGVFSEGKLVKKLRIKEYMYTLQRNQVLNSIFDDGIRKRESFLMEGNKFKLRSLQSYILLKKRNSKLKIRKANSNISSPGNLKDYSEMLFELSKSSQTSALKTFNFDCGKSQNTAKFSFNDSMETPQKHTLTNSETQAGDFYTIKKRNTKISKRFTQKLDSVEETLTLEDFIPNFILHSEKSSFKSPENFGNARTVFGMNFQKDSFEHSKPEIGPKIEFTNKFQNKMCISSKSISVNSYDSFEVPNLANRA